MTDADTPSSGEFEDGTDPALIGRLRAWHARTQPPEGAIERTIAHVEAQKRNFPRLTSDGIATPRLTRFWPAVAAAMIIVATLSITHASRSAGSGDSRWLASPTLGRLTGEAGLRVVRFAVALPADAPTDVRLVGDFNGWAPGGGVALARNPVTGRWEGDIALPPGLHHYTYLVDGSRWIVDPGAPLAGDDLLGATNAIVVPDSR